MPVNLIVIVIAAIVFLIIAFFYRGATFDKLPALPGEKVLFEESGVRVEQSGSPRTVIFMNCIIRVTGKRIIIAQKMLLSNQYALRHVIVYNGLNNSTDLKTSLKKGYLNIAVSKSDVKVDETGVTCTVRINIPESALTKNQYISYKTSGKEYYLNL